jgi:hypothetical protein
MPESRRQSTAVTGLQATIPGHSGRVVRYWSMGSEMAVNVPAVTRFVREVLGCGCPDEVFQNLEVRRGSVAVRSCSADYELRIGGRLLVVVTSEPVATLSPARLARVISEGKAARDDGKFNRFRLVVQTSQAAQHRARLLRDFEEISGRDEKTHLHVVERSQVPEFFPGTPPTPR